MNNPLSYRISDWTQLPLCKSNNSADLHIRVADFINDSRLNGQRITVYHDQLGELFSVVRNPSGTLVNTSVPAVVSDEDILKELSRYGFVIEYQVASHLSSGILQVLTILQGLGYDKIRTLSLLRAPERAPKTVVVAFNVESHPKWVDVEYSADYAEYSRSVVEGTACTLYSVSGGQQFDWTWLDFVANISDILRDNSLEV